MTTNQTPIPEPTSLTSVVVGKRDGETVVALLAHDDGYPWVAQTGDHRHCWRSWTGLCRELTDIRVVPVAEVAAQIDQLKARIRELEVAPALSEEQVEALRCAEKWLRKGGLAVLVLRDAFPDVFAEPEPGADIPDEVVKAAVNEWRQVTGTDREAMRAALSAADAKRAELEGQA